MASLSYRQLQIVEDYLGQIHHAILDLKEWNKGIDSPDTWLMSADGMKTLAANCMLLEAIGEGFKKVDALTKKQLLPSRPEIPWKQVMGMRDLLLTATLTSIPTSCGTPYKMICPLCRRLLNF